MLVERWLLVAFDDKQRDCYRKQTSLLTRETVKSWEIALEIEGIRTKRRMLST